MLNIPQKIERRSNNYDSPFLYRTRSTLVRMFCSVKELTRIATRYDRLTAACNASVCLASTASYLLWAPSVM